MSPFVVPYSAPDQPSPIPFPFFDLGEQQRFQRDSADQTSGSREAEYSGSSKSPEGAAEFNYDAVDHFHDKPKSIVGDRNFAAFSFTIRLLCRAVNLDCRYCPLLDNLTEPSGAFIRAGRHVMTRLRKMPNE